MTLTSLVGLHLPFDGRVLSTVFCCCKLVEQHCCKNHVEVEFIDINDLTHSSTTCVGQEEFLLHVCLSVCLSVRCTSCLEEEDNRVDLYERVYSPESQTFT